jgi:hypothetical protein
MVLSHPRSERLLGATLAHLGRVARQRGEGSAE